MKNFGIFRHLYEYPILPFLPVGFPYSKCRFRPGKKALTEIMDKKRDI
jgi:hypothetical protein